MKLYYVHDPMCSWCWAYRRVLKELKDNLQDGVEFISLLGGLAKDTNEPMPEQTRQYIQNHWRKIQEEVPGTPFNFEFWDKCNPRRSTYPACRAVIAAGLQYEMYKDVMTSAIQQAYYLNARNPSEDETLIELANEIGLNADQFKQDLNSEKTQELLEKDVNTARALQLNSFPGFLLMNHHRRQYMSPDYQTYEHISDAIDEFLA